MTVVVKAEVTGPDGPTMCGQTVPQEMRATGGTREEAVHNVKVRAANEHSGLFGADSIADIDVQHAEVIQE